MTVCQNCETVEPRTREATNEELKSLDLDPSKDDLTICRECELLEDTLVHYNEDAGLDR